MECPVNSTQNCFYERLQGGTQQKVFLKYLFGSTSWAKHFEFCFMVSYRFCLTCHLQVS